MRLVIRCQPISDGFSLFIRFTTPLFPLSLTQGQNVNIARMGGKSLSFLRRFRSQTVSHDVPEFAEPESERAALTEVYRGENPEVE